MASVITVDCGVPPHSPLEVAVAGNATPTAGDYAMILVHGRGAGAGGILPLGHEMLDAAGLSSHKLGLWAPSASQSTWYPNRFIAPERDNQPWLDSARSAIVCLIRELEARGVPPSHVHLCGFSQGACLVLDAAYRLPQRYASVMALSGGLIGPPGSTWDTSGSVNGTPVLIGCSDVDVHIPVERVRESAEVFEQMGAELDLRIYPGMGHTVNEDELSAAVALLQNVDA